MKSKTMGSTIIKTASSLMMPFIVLYGIYVQLNGEESPGGGFQSGVIISTAIILHALIYGYRNTLNIIPLERIKYSLCAGLAIYVSVGLLSLLFGGHFLEYAAIIGDFSMAQKLCIFAVEIGVGLAVCSAMLIFYFSFVLYKTGKK